MNNHSYNNHICNNTQRTVERSMQTRLESERGLIEKLLEKAEDIGNEESTHTDGCTCNNHNSEAVTNRIPCNTCENRCKNEHGGEVYATNVGRIAYKNNNFRESIWTGDYLQLTVMSINRGDDIGVEIHRDTDQYISVEYGMAMALTGENEHSLNPKCKLYQGDSIFIPAGTWHNIVNIGRCPLKLSSVYAPPHHLKCTIEKSKT